MNYEETYWYDEEIESSEGEEIIVNEYDISSVPNDYNISTIYNLIESGIVKIPDFQRNYVWDQKRASKLIESIILGLPIPQVFFYESERNNYLIIDGQQRLLSIYFFIKQRFPKATARNAIRKEFDRFGKITDQMLGDDNLFTNFSLKLNESGIVNNYNGQKYSTLEPATRNQFDHMRTIRSIVIRQNAPDDSDSSMFEIFHRLNTGGQNLTAQEIRASLFYSPFYNMLYQLNLHEKWRRVLQKPDIDVHSKDIEFLLRGFAILYWNAEYAPSMIKFLNKFSKKSKTFSDEVIEYFRLLFISFLDACDDLDDKAFCSTNGRFNVSLFDAVFTAACTEALKKKVYLTTKIKNNSIRTLKKNSEFNGLIQSNTASKKGVSERIRIATDIIELQ